MQLSRRTFFKGAAAAAAVLAAGTWIGATARARQPTHEHHMPVAALGETTRRLKYRGLNVVIKETATGVEVTVNGRVKRLMLEKQRDGCYWSHLRPFDDGCKDAVMLVKILIDMSFQGLFALE